MPQTIIFVSVIVIGLLLLAIGGCYFGQSRKRRHVADRTGPDDRQKCRRSVAHASACIFRWLSEVRAGQYQEKNMENPKTQRRAIGLLVVLATILTVIVTWNIPEATGD